MSQIFKSLQDFSGRCAYTPAELTVTEFPAEHGFFVSEGEYCFRPDGGDGWDIETDGFGDDFSGGF